MNAPAGGPLDDMTFTDDSPPPRSQWDEAYWAGVLAALKEQPRRWASIDNVPQRQAYKCKDRWAGVGVDVTMRDVERHGTRRGTLWLRYIGT